MELDYHKCAYCHRPLLDHEAVPLTVEQSVGPALTIQTCGQSCAALLVGAVFLFDVTIGKLKPIRSVEERQQIFSDVLSFQDKPVTQRVNSMLRLEFFSPNTRVRVLDLSLGVSYNREARKMERRNTLDSVYAREFIVDSGAMARQQAKMVDFFNRKQKPRFVKFTGIPTSDPDTSKRLRETFYMITPSEGSDVMAKGTRHYVGETDDRQFLVLAFEQDQETLKALYLISRPKQDKKSVYGISASYTLPADDVPAYPTITPMENDQTGMNLSQRIAHANRQPEYMSMGEAMSWNEEEEEEEEEDDEALMVGDRILFRARERVQPIFSWFQFQGKQLTVNQRTGQSFTDTTILARLSQLEDATRARAGLIRLITNDLDILESLTVNGRDNIMSRWRDSKLVRTKTDIILKVERYALPAPFLGRLAQRRKDARRITEVYAGFFDTLETSAWVNQASILNRSKERESDEATSAWRAQIYDQRSPGQKGRILMLLPTIGFDEIYLDEFFSWSGDALPTVQQASTIGLSIPNILDIHIRANAGYQELLNTGRPPKHNDIVVMLANMPFPGANPAQHRLAILIFKETASTMLRKDGSRLSRWKLIYLFSYDIVTIDFK